MKFTVRVPATSANLGPGFDTLALAFKLYNTFTFDIGEDVKQDERDNMILYSYRKTLAKEVAIPPKYDVSKLRISTGIPRSRGLGSSASCIVAGVAAAFAAMGGEDAVLDKDRIFNAACEIEGHPDNVAAAVYGGFTVSIKDEQTDRHYCKNFPHPQGFRYCVLIPEKNISTVKSRRRLPQELSYNDAVYNISHASMVTAAFLSGDLDMLAFALKDKMHQPYRLQSIPGAEDVMLICRANGAREIFLSGSGPSLLAVFGSDPSEFAQNADPLLKNCPGNWRAQILEPDNDGFVFNLKK